MSDDQTTDLVRAPTMTIKEKTASSEPEFSNAPRTSIATTAEGIFLPQSLDELWRLAKMYVASGMLPKAYSTPESVLTAMQYGMELGLKPLNALRQIAVVNGTPSLFGDLPLSLCMKHPLWLGIEEYLIDSKGEVLAPESDDFYGAVCKVLRRGEKGVECTFTVTDAKRANLWGKPGPWSQYPKDMLKYKARSRCLKSKFPDALNGISIAEYDFDLLPSQGGFYTSDSNVRPLNAPTGSAAGLTEALRKPAEPAAAPEAPRVPKSSKERELNLKMIENWIAHRKGKIDDVKHLFGGKDLTVWAMEATEAETHYVKDKLLAIKP